jgi:hypothetical protein
MEKEAITYKSILFSLTIEGLTSFEMKLNKVRNDNRELRVIGFEYLRPFPEKNKQVEIDLHRSSNMYGFRMLNGGNTSYMKLELASVEILNPAISGEIKISARRNPFLSYEPTLKIKVHKYDSTGNDISYYAYNGKINSSDKVIDLNKPI